MEPRTSKRQNGTLSEKLSDAAQRRHRNKFQQFESLPLETRLTQLEQRMDRLEKKSTLQRNSSIPENIVRWFRSHRYLATLQFIAELHEVEPGYKESAVRTALYRMAQQGKLIRVRDGLYTEP